MVGKRSALVGFDLFVRTWGIWIAVEMRILAWRIFIGSLIIVAIVAAIMGFIQLFAAVNAALN